MTDHAEDHAEEGRPPRCSAKGCAAPALWAIRWRNPKIHGPERRKTWLACDEHRAYLSDFLGRRDFPRDVIPAANLDADLDADHHADHDGDHDADHDGGGNAGTGRAGG